MKICTVLALLLALVGCGGGGSDAPMTSPAEAPNRLVYASGETVFPLAKLAVSEVFTNSTASRIDVDVTMSVSALLQGPAAGRVEYNWSTGERSQTYLIPLGNGIWTDATRTYRVSVPPGGHITASAGVLIDSASGAASIEWHQPATITFTPV
jgi:hypothetical protein